MAIVVAHVSNSVCVHLHSGISDPAVRTADRAGGGDLLLPQDVVADRDALDRHRRDRASVCCVEIFEALVFESSVGVADLSRPAVRLVRSTESLRVDVQSARFVRLRQGRCC